MDPGHGIYHQYADGHKVMAYYYEPGDCWALIEGMGIAVRHSDGKTILVMCGSLPHPFETDGLGEIPWRAACV